MLDFNLQCPEERTPGPGGVCQSKGQLVEDYYFALLLDPFEVMRCAHLTGYKYQINGAVILFNEFYCLLLNDAGMYDQKSVVLLSIDIDNKDCRLNNTLLSQIEHSECAGNGTSFTPLPSAYIGASNTMSSKTSLEGAWYGSMVDRVKPRPSTIVPGAQRHDMINNGFFDTTNDEASLWLDNYMNKYILFLGCFSCVSPESELGISQVVFLIYYFSNTTENQENRTQQPP